MTDVQRSLAADTMIEIQRLRREYGSTVAVDDVTVSFARGRIITLLGENGSGKSTVIKTISGIVEPTSGTVSIDGEKITRFTPNSMRNHGVSVCHQELLVAPNRSIDDNVHLGRHSLWRRSFSRAEQRAQTTAVLAELGAPDLDITAPVGLQPIVVQQLVVIARSLVVEAPVLVLDEPTAALGHAERQALFGVLRGRRDRGVAVILVSHRMDEVLQLSDEVVVLANGHLVGIVQRGDFDEQRLLEMMVA